METSSFYWFSCGLPRDPRIRWPKHSLPKWTNKPPFNNCPIYSLVSELGKSLCRQWSFLDPATHYLNSPFQIGCAVVSQWWFIFTYVNTIGVTVALQNNGQNVKLLPWGAYNWKFSPRECEKNGNGKKKACFSEVWRTKRLSHGEKVAWKEER